MVATGSDAVGLGAVGGLLAALGPDVPDTVVVLTERSAALNKSIDLATDHPGSAFDVVCRDNVAARSAAEVMTGQVSQHGAGGSIEDLVVLLTVGTSLSQLVLVHLVQFLVHYEVERASGESLDLHLVVIDDGDDAQRSIEFAEEFSDFFDFTLHDSVREAVQAVAAGVAPTSVFVDGVDRDDTARIAEELSSRFPTADVLVDLSDYRSSSPKVVTTEAIVADSGAVFTGPVRRAHSQLLASLTGAGSGRTPSLVDLEQLLAHLRHDIGCTVRPTWRPIDGATTVPESMLPADDVWSSDPALVESALAALRDAGIVIDLPD